MNTHHIPVLLEVNLCHSINRAAQNLYMSQPQVSHIIRSIEQEVGFEIFLRSKTGVTPTPQGQLYLESLRMISTELEKIATIPHQFEERRDLSIASIYSRFLFQTFLQFRNQYPADGICDHFSEETNEMVMEQVASNRARMGLLSRIRTVKGQITQTLDRYGLEGEIIRSGLPFYVILGQQHPLSKLPQLTPEDLQNQAWVCYRRADMSFLEQMFALQSSAAELLVSDRASFLEALSSGQYLSVSTTSSELVTEGNKYVYLPVEGVHHISELYCIMPRLYKSTSRERQFLSFLKQTFRQYYGEEEAVSSDIPSLS